MLSILTASGSFEQQIYWHRVQSQPTEPTMNVLQINSSARREASHSTRLANRIVQRLRGANPDATLTVRDLGLNPHPVLDEATPGALFTSALQRTPEQTA